MQAELSEVRDRISPHPAPIGPAGACVSEPMRVAASNTIGSTIRRADRQMHRFLAAGARSSRPARTGHAPRALGARDADRLPVAVNGWSGHGLPMKNPAGKPQ